VKPYNPVKKQVHQHKNKGLKIQVSADISEALKQMKEVIAVVNECVAASEKLDKVMGKFTTQNVTVEIYYDSKVITQSTIKQTTESIKMILIDLKEMR